MTSPTDTRTVPEDQQETDSGAAVQPTDGPYILNPQSGIPEPRPGETVHAWAIWHERHGFSTSPLLEAAEDLIGQDAACSIDVFTDLDAAAAMRLANRWKHDEAHLLPVEIRLPGPRARAGNEAGRVESRTVPEDQEGNGERLAAIQRSVEFDGEPLSLTPEQIDRCLAGLVKLRNEVREVYRRYDEIRPKGADLAPLAERKLWVEPTSGFDRATDGLFALEDHLCAWNGNNGSDDPAPDAEVARIESNGEVEVMSEVMLTAHDLAERYTADQLVEACEHSLRRSTEELDHLRTVLRTSLRPEFGGER